MWGCLDVKSRCERTGYVFKSHFLTFSHPHIQTSSHPRLVYFFGISNRFPTTVQFTTFHHAVM